MLVSNPLCEKMQMSAVTVPLTGRCSGIALPPRRITATQLTRLVTDRSLAEAAGEVRDEMEAMPPPAALVERLAALAGKEHTWHTAC